jgi:hypothetical protein
VRPKTPLKPHTYVFSIGYTAKSVSGSTLYFDRIFKPRNEAVSAQQVAQRLICGFHDPDSGRRNNSAGRVSIISNPEAAAAPSQIHAVVANPRDSEGFA